MDRTIRALANAHCNTGENPYWKPADQSVWWTDIPNGKVYRYDTATGAFAAIYTDPAPVGGFTLQADGNWLLFRERDVARLSPDGKVTIVMPFFDDGMTRFNDVQADPEGRVFAGTMGRTDDSGGLFRFDRNGTVTKLFNGTGCSNGMGFTPDGQHFFWTNTTTRQIFRFRYHRATGELTDRELFYQAVEGEGYPDGMTVDENGEVWSARWDGHAIVHHGTDGRAKNKIEFPVAKVSSACFGGPDLATLYVTTAGGKAGSDTADGTLYCVDLNVRGLPEPVSAILI